jgi:hypothetical protein
MPFRHFFLKVAVAYRAERDIGHALLWSFRVEF